MKLLSIKLGFVWLSLLLAGLNAHNSFEFFSWMSVVFISVMFHELGHALAARIFGKTPFIELGFFGGTTYFRQEGLKKWQLFLITLNGPLFGFILFFISSLAVGRLDRASGLGYACQLCVAINLFWTVFNLLPILPLDGGQLLRVIFEAIFKNRGLYFTGIFSSLFSAVLALIAFLLGQYFIGSLLFLFFFKNFELVKQARYLSLSDQEEGFKKKIEQAAYLFETGQLTLAEPLLVQLKLETKQGMIFHQALAMLVMIYRERKEYSLIYDTLKPFPRLYQNELAAVMHEASFFQNDLLLTDRLSSEAFQKEATIDVALHAALASASRGHNTACVGWLKTACELGFNLDEIKAHPVLKGYIDQLNV